MILLLLCISALLCSSVYSTESVEWCYHKPECNFTTWPKISPEFCNGSRQSPIDIVTAKVQPNSKLTSFNFTGFDDNSIFHTIENNGETVKVTMTDGKMKVEGGNLPGTYTTAQFHLHWGNGSSSGGSEHTVDGKQYPMELHILNVHSKYNGSVSAAIAANDSTALAALAFFIEGTNGTNGPASWQNLTSYLPNITVAGAIVNFTKQMTMDSLLEGVNRTKYYRYEGSITVPNCNEIVIWTVFKDTIKINHELIRLFSTVHFKDTNATVLNTNSFRGVQELNGRIVTSQVAPAASSAIASAYCISTILLLSSLCWL